MHKSRLSTFVIDCRTGGIDQTARFWSAALGRGVKAPDDPLYRELESTREEPTLRRAGQPMALNTTSFHWYMSAP